MNFTVDKRKAVEAIVYVALAMPGAGRFHISKALYFAELQHLREFGRPIYGDSYIAMDNGPVPSFAYDVLKGNLLSDDKALSEGAFVVDTSGPHPRYKAARDPNLAFFSKSDLIALDEAISHCAGRSFGSISDETHKHKGWQKANLNSPMQFDDMLEGAEPETIESAKEFASYGVL